MNPALRKALLITTAFAVSTLSMAIWAVRAKAHEAPTGWSYDEGCCSNQDCRQIDPAEISIGPTGYGVPSGEVIRYTGDARLRLSPDGKYHWCYAGSHPDWEGEIYGTICLYVPSQGS